MVLDGRFIILNVSKSKQQLARPSTGPPTLSHLIIWKNFKGVFLTADTNRTFFDFCIVAASIFSSISRTIYPKSHKEKVQRLKFNAKWKPMHLFSIASFEKSNNVSLIVYQLHNHKLVAFCYCYSKKKLLNDVSNYFVWSMVRKIHTVWSKTFPNYVGGSLNQRWNEGRIPGQNSVQTASSPLYKKTT